MRWNERIDFSIRLMKEVCAVSKSDGIDTDDLKGVMEAISDYSSSSDFMNLDEKLKEHDSICILSDAIQACFPKMVHVKNDIAAEPPEYMSISTAKKNLSVEYMEAFNAGASDIVCLNINDWINQMGVIIVDDDDEHLKK